MTINLFVIANVKQLRIDGSFRVLLPFSRTSWGFGFRNSAIFNSFYNRDEFGKILEGFRIFGGGRGVGPPTPPRYAGGVSVLLASPPAALCVGKRPLCLSSRRVGGCESVWMLCRRFTTDSNKSYELRALNDAPEIM